MSEEKYHVVLICSDHNGRPAMIKAESTTGWCPMNKNDVEHVNAAKDFHFENIHELEIGTLEKSRKILVNTQIIGVSIYK